MINIFGLLLLCVAVVTAAPAAGTKADPTIASIYTKCANPIPGRFCIGTNAAKDADCIETSGGCDVLVTYERTSEGKHNFDLITKRTTGYAVLAFSDDNQDGGDSMIVCQKSIVSSVSKDKAEGSVSAIVKLDDESGLTFAYNGVSENHIICSLTVDNAVTYNEKVINLDGTTEYYLFAASGSLGFTGNIEAPTSTVKSPGAHFKLTEVDPIYNKCGEAKYTCFGTSSGTTDDTKTCVPAKNCKVLTVYESTADNKFKYDLITTQADGYGAVGFTEDPIFGGGAGDGVVVCQFKTGTEAEVKKYKYSGTTFTADTTVTDITETSGKVAEAHLICTFTLANSVKFDSVTVSLAGETGYHLFAGYGALDNTAPGALDGKVVSEGSYFRVTQVDFIYSKCSAGTGAVCVGTKSGTNDETCVADKDCNILIVYEYLDDNSEHKFNMITKNEYGAMAFSADEAMGDDGGILCKKSTTTTGQIDVKKIKLVPNNIENVDDTEGVTTTTADNIVEDDHIICKFSLADTVNYNDVVTSLAGVQEYYILGAYGSVDESGKPETHEGTVVSNDKKFKNLAHYVGTLYTKCNTGDVICVGTSDPTKADSDCLTSKDCKVLTRYEYTADGKHIVNLCTTEENRYAAVSFSADDKRGDNDPAVVCRKETTLATTVKTVKAIIETTAIEELPDTTGLKPLTEVIGNEGIVCEFELNKIVSFKPTDNITLSLVGDKPYYLRTEYGTVKSDGKPDQPTAQATTDKKFERAESEIPVNLYKACEEEKEKVECVGGYLKEDGRTDDCVKTKDCAFLAVYRKPDSGEEPRFQLIADRPSEYIAIGFSEDDKMGDDKLVECIPSNTENPLQKAATGTGAASHEVTLDGTKSELTKNNITDDYKSFIYCDFSMERDNEYKDKTIVLARTSEYNLLVAVGPLDDGKVGYHIGAVASQKKMFKSSAPSFMAASVFSYIILTFITALFK